MEVNEMYIFISHSSKDKDFVRQLANSVEFYGIPSFLDERDIKVGDSIPTSVYGALNVATHVIYVISNNSIASRWVEEELSVAKMRQLSDRGCTILPVLIDEVTPPVSISHIKYADFRKWAIKEFYFEELRHLLDALGVKAQYSNSAEVRLFLQHLPELIKMKELADSAVQLYFQLERLWFSEFNPGGRGSSTQQLRYWFYESVSKTFRIDEFTSSYKTLTSLGTSEDETETTTLKLANSSKNVLEDYLFFYGTPAPEDDDPSLAYIRIWKAEENARRLSSLISSVLLEIKGLIV